MTVYLQKISDNKKKRHTNSLQSFRKVINKLDHSVFITDIEGTIEYVNDSAIEKTGYSEKELIGENPRILQSGEHGEAFYADLWETILSGNTWTGELINQRKTGERYIIRQTITPITDESGSPVKFIAINREISEQKLRKQRVEVLNRILRHNLRNSATVIHGYIEEIESSISGGPTRLADIIKRETQSLIQLGENARQSNELLTRTSREDSVDLSSVVYQVKEHIQTEYESMSINVETNPDDTVQADRELLTEILREVFTNAIEHTDTANPVIHLQTKAVDQHIIIRIQDNGPGIPEEELSPLNDGTETKLRHGSGLGLWLIKWGTRQLRGTVSFTNTDDGTEVKLVLPADN